MSHAADIAELRARGTPRRRLLLGWSAIVAITVLTGAAALPAGAQPQPGSSAALALERSVKAAFLYKFLGYVEFPAGTFADAAAPLAIGVIGADELAAELSRLVAGRSVQSRQVVVRTFRDNETPAGVQLLFIGGDEDSARLRAIVKAGVPPRMLIVTEAENALQHGSIINFKIVEQRVRFDVSLEAAERHSIKLSSRLLTVANQVHKGAP